MIPLIFLLAAASFVYGSWRLSPTAGVIVTAFATGLLIFGGLCVLAWRLLMYKHRKALRGMNPVERAELREVERVQRGV